MTSNPTMLGSLYLLLAIILLLGSLVGRREPLARTLVMALAWVAIFGAGFVLFTFRDDIGWVGQRLRAEALGTPVVAGKETRIPMALDGHFWVEAEVNGHKVRFLIDSGATMTTIDRRDAKAANVWISPRRDQIVRTGNGLIHVAVGRAARLRVGAIERRDEPVQVDDGAGFNVLGMSFLSGLRRWGVDGRWLILVP